MRPGGSGPKPGASPVAGSLATPKKERITLKKYAQGTWLEPEEAAYPHGGQSRRGLAVWPDGKKRRVYAGVPDTWFSIPAHGKLYRNGRTVYIGGFLTVDDEGALRFHAMAKY